jgi:hypothetical protein
MFALSCFRVHRIPFTFVTIAKRPFFVGRDGERYAGDLGQKGMKIFLRRGLDRYAADLPVETEQELGIFES